MYELSKVSLRPRHTARQKMEHCLRKSYDIFHNERLLSVPHSHLKYNRSQRFVSPRPCQPHSEIYPGPRVVSNIDELIAKETIMDPKSSKFRKAYRVHMSEREMDDWVWADDLLLDRRYTQMVMLFEKSMSAMWDKLKKPFSWAACKKVFKRR